MRKADQCGPDGHPARRCMSLARPEHAEGVLAAV